MVRRALVLSSLLLSCALGRTAPADAQSATAPAPAYTVEREVASAADGTPLVFRRLRVPGAVPVLLLHGVGANGFEWDLPSKSFARALAARGFDVWIANHRRVGKHGYRSGGAAGYDFDDLALLDLHAMVEKVLAATGERPFLVGHSMGGMMSYCWLQGAAYERVPVRRRPRLGAGGLRWEDVTATRVEGSAARAAARNASVRGLVAIASPPRMDWPARRATVFDFWRHSYWDYNILLRDLSWSPAAIAAARTVDHVPSGRVLDIVTDDLTRFPYVGPHVRRFLGAAAARVGRSFLAAQLMYPANMEGHVFYEAIDEIGDDTSAPVFGQFMDWIRMRTLREAHVLDPLRRPYVYADHLDRITAPVLFVAGRYDKWANDDTIEREGYGRVGSVDKAYLAVDYGHLDIVIGRDAPRDVWAPIFAWLAARR